MAQNIKDGDVQHHRWEKVCNCAGHLHPSHFALFNYYFPPILVEKSPNLRSENIALRVI
jgi:hypothetical protein